jgi:hypothetical protein
VNVLNTPLPVTGTIEPFSQRLDINVNANQARGSFVVPAGKTLVIDYISSDAASNGTVVYFLVATFLRGNEVEAHIPMVPVGTFLGRNTYAMSTPVKIYADGNSTVTIVIQTVGADGGGGIVGVYGHLVQAP